MKRLEVNPNNEKYYTKDFISGYRCGTKRQLESDLTVLDKIMEEIEQMPSELTTDGRRMIRRGNVFRIINKYKTKSEEYRNEPLDKM